MKDLINKLLLGIGIAVVAILAVPMVLLIVISSLLDPEKSKKDHEKEL